MSPTISVIIPVFNAEQTVSETLRSVQEQSFTELEIVVVDDGSTDGSPARVRDAMLGDSRIVYLRQGNRGVSAARNRGLRESRGSLVSVIDADDLWHPEKLARQAAALGQRRDGAVLCGIRRFLLDGRETVWLSETIPPELAPGAAALDALIVLRSDQMALIHTALFWRDQLERLGGWAEGQTTAEDWDLWLRAARSGVSFFNLSEPLYFYRKHAASATARETLERALGVHVTTIEREWTAGGVSRGARDQALRRRYLSMVDARLRSGNERAAFRAWSRAIRLRGALGDRELWRRLARIAHESASRRFAEA